MPTLRPFRDVDYHNVLNLYTVTGTLPVLKGNFVKIISGWSTEQELQQLGDVGLHAQNAVSQRWGIAPFCAVCDGSGDSAIGVMLYDVRETDENGEKLVFKPEKLARMQSVLSGQACPIATKGVFLYSGVNGGGRNPVTVTAGNPAYLGIDGGVNTSGTTTNGSVTRVGTFLGPADKNGWVLLKVQL